MFKLASCDHEPNPDTQDAVESFVFKHLPSVSQRLKHWSGCYYTLTPDEHFIVDRLPGHANVTVVAELSGHGFKFTSVLGEIVADLSTDKPVNFDLSCFRIDRFL